MQLASNYRHVDEVGHTDSVGFVGSSSLVGSVSVVGSVGIVGRVGSIGGVGSVSTVDAVGSTGGICHEVLTFIQISCGHTVGYGIYYVILELKVEKLALCIASTVVCILHSLEKSDAYFTRRGLVRINFELKYEVFRGNKLHQHKTCAQADAQWLPGE